MSKTDRSILAAKTLVAIACVAGAAVMGVEGRDGWGWFLFVALCLF